MATLTKNDKDVMAGRLSNVLREVAEMRRALDRVEQVVNEQIAKLEKSIRKEAA